MQAGANPSKERVRSSIREGEDRLYSEIDRQTKNNQVQMHCTNKMKMTENIKRTSLLHCGINYGIDNAPGCMGAWLYPTPIAIAVQGPAL